MVGHKDFGMGDGGLDSFPLHMVKFHEDANHNIILSLFAFNIGGQYGQENKSMVGNRP